jgi:GDPmannose 4,6-dehydratase
MTTNKSALITGITGQDGLYLAELLLEKNYKVFGLIRGQNNPKENMVREILPDVELINGDLTDPSSLFRAIDKSTEDANKTLKNAVDAISNKQQKLSDSAELAGESLDKIKIKEHISKEKEFKAKDKRRISIVEKIAEGKVNLMQEQTQQTAADLQDA